MKANCQYCGIGFTYYPSNKAGKYCSLSCCVASPEWRSKIKGVNLGRKHTREAKLKMSISRRGVPKTKEWIKKQADALKGRKAPWATGENSNFWKGGITDLYRDLRKTTKYYIWRKSVLSRDNYTCVICGRPGNVADHIIPFASLYHESEVIKDQSGLFDIDNGRTLCLDCHKNTDTYNQKVEKQIEYRLLSTIKELWDKRGQDGDFDVFYRQQIEKVIERIKSLIDEEEK